ncbi:uncharacterized protein E0L32_004940 [Thyridium curvatum]|uniref:Protein kinase domain-containing protein n=1 Tax=Thyridium curvatum TaxID=1093900 RepID=A0A507BCZ0_9PEZI|nr:uncharacterized protein E0L32_004940 [Thyridium curvatum]TPX14831.1 hypothetical protein E0L32_004940 [Thyridium curvatum]
MDDKREPSCPRYELESYVTSIHDDNAKFTLEVLRSGEEVIGDIYDTDVFEWVLQPFERLFAELAPSPALPDNHAGIKVTLQEYLFPKFFIFVLDVVKEKLQPRQIEMEKSPYSPSNVWLDDEFLDDLKKWTSLYNPAGIVLSFENPEDALYKPPRKVLIDGGQTACFFKQCYSTVQTTNELQAYKKIAAANIDPQFHICRLFGAVMDDDGFIVGLLLTYIDHGGRTLSTNVDPDYPPASTRNRWIGQLDAALAELHKAGIVWGDVKAENVLVDREDNVWIIDFGGGYTQGWVDKQLAGTVDGDLAGMAKLREFIFQDGAQDRWWAR